MNGGTPSRFFGRDGLPLAALKEINGLPRVEKERIYRTLLPPALFAEHGFDPVTLAAPGGATRIRFIAPEGIGLLRIEARLRPEDLDCLFFLELADTPYGPIELSFCLINDPDAPRFDIDRDSRGRDNCFGTLRRNLPEEIRAMAAGLSPNQARRGLQLFSPFFAQFEEFVERLGIDTIVAEPLSYSNAIRYEGYGFDYLTGKQLMRWIDREFRPGGILYRRLDGSTPFRRPGMERTVRGRSWAIQDGILERPWDGVKIYKTVGRHAGVDTFADRIY
jgi:hypothetical protein